MDQPEHAVEKGQANTHSGKPSWKLSSLSTYTKSNFCPLQWLWNPAGTGELKQANLHLIWLTVCASKCVEKNLILLGECGKHFQLSRTPWTRWQMGRVWAWHGRGHFRTGCCSKPCGRQSKPICHKKIKLTLELPKTKAQGEPLPAAQPGRDTHPAKEHHWKPPMKLMSTQEGNKTKQNTAKLFLVFFPSR